MQLPRIGICSLCLFYTPFTLFRCLGGIG
jgi:hypothetical protein